MALSAARKQTAPAGGGPQRSETDRYSRLPDLYYNKEGQNTYFDVEVIRDGYQYNLHFEKGNIAGEMEKKPVTTRKTGTRQRWKPDLEVFTDINIPTEYFLDTIKKQAVVNPGVVFEFVDKSGEKPVKTEFCYQNGISDYLAE